MVPRGRWSDSYYRIKQKMLEFHVSSCATTHSSSFHFFDFRDKHQCQQAEVSRHLNGAPGFSILCSIATVVHTMNLIFCCILFWAGNCLWTMSLGFWAGDKAERWGLQLDIIIALLLKQINKNKQASKQEKPAHQSNNKTWEKWERKLRPRLSYLYSLAFMKYNGGTGVFSFRWLLFSI
jgi:hypothetical protein